MRPSPNNVLIEKGVQPAITRNPWSLRAWLDRKEPFTAAEPANGVSRRGFASIDPDDAETARMIEIVPADEGLFRNVSPKAVEDMLKAH